MPAKPEPMSKPFEAGKLNMALARSASSRSKTGSPQPGGTPRATPSTMPPTVSPALRTFLMIRLIEKVRKAGDTVGGIVEGVARGVPPGWGEPGFDRLEADLGEAMLSLPASKGFDVG